MMQERDRPASVGEQHAFRNQNNTGRSGHVDICCVPCPLGAAAHGSNDNIKQQLMQMLAFLV